MGLGPQDYIERSGQHKQGWFAAYGEFLKDPNESKMLKLAPFVVTPYVPVAILDELIPILGSFDDIPTVAIVAIVAAKTISRVRNHR